MRTYRKILVLFTLLSMCFAFAAASENEGAVKKHKKPARAEAKKEEKCEACEAIKRLEDKIAAQQAEIDALKAAQQPAAAPPPTADEQARAAAAEAKRQADQAAAAAAEANAKAAAAQAENEELKKGIAEASAAAQQAEKKAAALEEPAYIHYKGVRIYPGGWLQGSAIYRTHNANADTASNFAAFPLSGSASSKVNEWRESGRATRLALRVEGETQRLKMLGYVETDFLGTTPNATESQTNSFSLRLRVGYASVAFHSGWRITGGQTYNLMTPNRVLADPLTEALPLVIDNSFYTGYAYAREGTFRVSKTIGHRAAIAIAVENPETVASVSCLQVASASAAAVLPASCAIGTSVQGLQNSLLSTSPASGTFGINTPSVDTAPDLAGKIVIEPGWGHFEVVAMGRFFRDRVFPAGAPGFPIGAFVTGSTGTNKVNAGGGAGFNAILPVVPKKADVILHVFGGRGVGRFGSAGGPDVTVRPFDGSLEPIKGLQASAGIELHPTPKFDFYVYGGDEYYGKTSYAITPTAGNTFIVGFGDQAFTNGGCNLEFPSTTATSALQCQSVAQNRNLWEVTPGFWYRVYKGKEGSVAFGAEYEYNYRRTWTGTAFSAGAVGAPGVPLFLVKPVSIENSVMLAMRYYWP